MSGFCKICDEYVYECHGGKHAHVCPPTFLVWQDGCHGANDDGDKVYALDHKTAAEKWAEQDDSDSAEYAIVHGNPATVRVRVEADACDEKWFRVEGEAVPSYSAHEIPSRAGAES
jgi:hypothetical protein